nr:asparagine synthetase domain-containing protein 1-like isoform X1 [Cherax quadricarinatus]XP_053646488.1 asparagine synthetase domain-containing protein 1-like isoform X1 [Cherax quadricarinatus]
MCGICFMCGWSISAQMLQEQVLSCCSSLSNRGPDACAMTLVPITAEVVGLFEGCLLWLQGDQPTTQPLLDHRGNLLLWNGDILAGLQITKGMSDTQYISESLSTKEEADITSFLGNIKGPWALIYYQKHTQRLYFGRDVLGRHSLLWRLPSDTSRVFLIASVCRQDDRVKEIPALGLYYVDFSVVNLAEEFTVNLIPWTHVAEETLLSMDSVINIKKHKISSCIQTRLNMCVPSIAIIENIKALPCSLDEENVKVLYLALEDDVANLLKILTNSIRRRVEKCPPKCRDCTNSTTKCVHTKVAVLFSGGLDSAMIALLLDSCLPESESVDLLNVAFPQKIPQNNRAKKLNTKKMSSSDGDSPRNYEVPDRISGRQCWHQLQELRPLRRWNFVEINVSSAELAEERESVIRHLVAPLTSVLDDSIGCALWFGGRGRGAVVGVPYTSPARVLLCGMGADEQLGGYSRHRARFTAAGWSALLEEISLEISRIHTRNLGRDNRILSDHGRAPRFPYLDEDVVNFLNSLPVWIKANLYLPRGVGEKLVLRVAAAHLGLTAAAALPKRAIQFGSRIAKLENSRERGSDPCVRLVEK